MWNGIILSITSAYNYASQTVDYFTKVANHGREHNQTSPYIEHGHKEHNGDYDVCNNWCDVEKNMAEKEKKKHVSQNYTVFHLI